MQSFAANVRLTDIDGAFEDSMDIHIRRMEFKLAARNAGQIEQVINETGFELDVAADQRQLWRMRGGTSGSSSRRNGGNQPQASAACAARD